MYRDFLFLRKKETPPPLGRRKRSGEKGLELRQDYPQVSGDFLGGGEKMGKELVEVFFKALRKNGAQLPA
jgi:hypothetical protein